MRVEQNFVTVLGQAPALPTEIGLGWKGLQRTKTVAYQENTKITDLKSFRRALGSYSQLVLTNFSQS